MTFERYWQTRVDATPKLRGVTDHGDRVMRITVASFREELRRAFEAGAAASRPNADADDKEKRWMDFFNKEIFK